MATRNRASRSSARPCATAHHHSMFFCECEYMIPCATCEFLSITPRTHTLHSLHTPSKLSSQSFRTNTPHSPPPLSLNSKIYSQHSTLTSKTSLPCTAHLAAAYAPARSHSTHSGLQFSAGKLHYSVEAPAAAWCAGVAGAYEHP